MATFLLSFRVEDDTERATYRERYDALHLAIDTMASKTWTETTSFVLFETATESIDVVGRRLVAGLDDEVDVVILRKIDWKIARYWGNVTDGDILQLMPGISPLNA